ncbi:MAG: hypothetical protein IPQ10_05995 [Saprospiraceae bacterium]|nr:hypothetical protein [Saprospiraceae bacterium]MBL0260609.1 hypothetical protein [Saprospiraceae bacterium]
MENIVQVNEFSFDAFVLFLKNLSVKDTSLFYSYDFQKNASISLGPSAFVIFLENKGNNKTLELLVSVRRGVVISSKLRNNINYEFILILDMLSILTEVKISQLELIEKQEKNGSDALSKIKFYFTYLDSISNQKLFQAFQSDYWIKDPLCIGTFQD